MQTIKLLLYINHKENIMNEKLRDICKKITENHGGNIVAESTKNVGTCFYINLPFNKNK